VWGLEGRILLKPENGKAKVLKQAKNSTNKKNNGKEMNLSVNGYSYIKGTSVGKLVLFLKRSS